MPKETHNSIGWNEVWQMESGFRRILQDLTGLLSPKGTNDPERFINKRSYNEFVLS